MKQCEIARAYVCMSLSLPLSFSEYLAILFCALFLSQFCQFYVNLLSLSINWSKNNIKSRVGRWSCLLLLPFFFFFFVCCFALRLLSYAGNQFYCTRKRQKQNKTRISICGPRDTKFSITFPLSFSPSLCLSAKNSCKLFINALERNFLLSLRDHSLWILRSLSPSLSWLQFKHLSRVESTSCLPCSNSTTYPNGLAPN